MFPLFEEPGFDRRKLARRLAALAADDIWIGTSSWKYEGWLGQIYSRERYLVRGRFSEKRFQADCLAEYAETFPIVCGDFSFYQFPSDAYWRRLFASAPPELRFALKVPEEITVKRFPAHARYGPRGGQANDSFLNAELVESAFLTPLAPFRARVPVLIFEFGAFGKRSYENAGGFLEDLDGFLAALPRGFRYAVEIRNQEFLAPAYFDCLRRHDVAHVFNAWTRMPELGEQMRTPGAFTTGFFVTRALLRRGRPYEQAVAEFSPYEKVKDENPAARDALRALIRHARDQHVAAFIFVNNRLEGNAPQTIQAVVEE